MEVTRITTKEIQKTQELIDFIKKSPSCYHVVHNIIRVADILLPATSLP